MNKTTEQTIYVVINHNNGYRYITEDVDAADLVATNWDVYCEGDSAVTVHAIPKAQYVRYCAAQTMLDCIENIRSKCMANIGDLPF